MYQFTIKVDNFNKFKKFGVAMATLGPYLDPSLYIYLGYGELLTYIHFPYFYYAYKFDDVTNVQSNGIYIISLLFFFSTFGRINVMYFPIKSYECLSKLSIQCSNIYFAMC